MVQTFQFRFSLFCWTRSIAFLDLLCLPKGDSTTRCVTLSPVDTCFPCCTGRSSLVSIGCFPLTSLLTRTVLWWPILWITRSFVMSILGIVCDKVVQYVLSMCLFSQHLFQSWFSKKIPEHSMTGDLLAAWHNSRAFSVSPLDSQVTEISRDPNMGVSIAVRDYILLGTCLIIHIPFVASTDVKWWASLDISVYPYLFTVSFQALQVETVVLIFGCYKNSANIVVMGFFLFSWRPLTFMLYSLLKQVACPISWRFSPCGWWVLWDARRRQGGVQIETEGADFWWGCTGWDHWEGQTPVWHVTISAGCTGRQFDMSQFLQVAQVGSSRKDGYQFDLSPFLQHHSISSCCARQSFVWDYTFWHSMWCQTFQSSHWSPLSSTVTATLHTLHG